MTNKQLKNLKDTLWTTADQLRANSGLKSTEYAEPILGLIFLRFADVKYSKFEPEIKAEFNSTKGTRMERPIHEIAIEKCGFYLPEEARYDWLLNLPESEDLAKKVKEAMEAVEKYTAELEDTLPKDIYYSVTGRAALVMANSASDAGNSEKDIRIKLIESGIISQMVTLPSNMFTSVTLPATLWFFDKAKVKKDEILFIDARNIFTQIDRAHRKFSDEQIRNLGIITRLYEGKTEEFEALLADYRAKLADAPELSDDEDIMPKSYWQSNIDWLTERFPEGKYRDVVGLCKAATIGKIYDDKGKVVGYKDDSIGDQDFSLNPGRYVGVVIEDDGLTQEEFKERMMAYYTVLSELNADARNLEKSIAQNLQELFEKK